jgi:tetratricopeptide (TPR) repeat protein
MWTKCLATFQICLLPITLAACNRHVPAAAASRIPIPASPPPSLAALGEADRAFAAKEYEEASRAYEEYVRLTPSEDQRDQALFRLGLASVLRKSGTDWPRAQAVWKRLIGEYPDSPFIPEIELMLSLYAEAGQAGVEMKLRDDRIRQISTELDRLKKIDSERRKGP